jgi:hypothetical protein
VNHYPFPHDGQWAVGHIVPGTDVVHIDTICFSLEAALRATRELNDTLGPDCAVSVEYRHRRCAGRETQP